MKKIIALCVTNTVSHDGQHKLLKRSILFLEKSILYRARIHHSRRVQHFPSACLVTI